MKVDRGKSTVSAMLAAYPPIVGAVGGSLSGHMTVGNWLIVAAFYPVSYAAIWAVFTLMERP